MATAPQLPGEARANADHCRAVATYIDVFLVRQVAPQALLPPDAWGARSREVHDARIAVAVDQLAKVSTALQALAAEFDRWAGQLQDQVDAERAQAALPHPPGWNPASPFG